MIETLGKLPEEPKNIAKSLLSQEKEVFMLQELGDVTKNRLVETYIHLGREGVHRCPIIGLKDGSIHLLVDKEAPDHRTLVQKLSQQRQKELEIAFTTSFETFSLGSRTPDEYPYILAFDTGSISMGLGSDNFKPGFTSEGQRRVQEIFQPYGAVLMDSRTKQPISID